MTCATASRRPWRRSATATRPSPWRRSSAGSGRRRRGSSTAFPIDRRELAEHAALGLTEARVRGAIRTLEEVGFLDRAVRLGLDPQADAGRAAPQAGAVHVRERLWPAVQRGQQAGCGGP